MSEQEHASYQRAWRGFGGDVFGSGADRVVRVSRIETGDSEAEPDADHTATIGRCDGEGGWCDLFGALESVRERVAEERAGGGHRDAGEHTEEGGVVTGVEGRREGEADGQEPEDRAYCGARCGRDEGAIVVGVVTDRPHRDRDRAESDERPEGRGTESIAFQAGAAPTQLVQADRDADAEAPADDRTCQGGEVHHGGVALRDRSPGGLGELEFGWSCGFWGRGGDFTRALERFALEWWGELELSIGGLSWLLWRVGLCGRGGRVIDGRRRRELLSARGCARAERGDEAR